MFSPGVHRHLVKLVRQHPFWTLNRFATEMDKWERESAAARPAGAVVVIGPKPCIMTIRRCLPHLVFDKEWDWVWA